MMQLSKFSLGSFTPGRSYGWQILWFLVGAPIVRCSLNPFSSSRRLMLRLFGAKVGSGVTIRPGVRVKYPWRLSVGDYTMIGEDVWIDNLVQVNLGSNVCISQGAYLCTGNHDWSSPFFAYKLSEITVHDGAWIGARALIAPNVTVGASAVVSAGAVCTRSVAPYKIVAGNPAEEKRTRIFNMNETECLDGNKPRMRW
jgi:putative colanic acid biosynthesis acetyltransferase WcaF